MSLPWSKPLQMPGYPCRIAAYLRKHRANDVPPGHHSLQRLTTVYDRTRWLSLGIASTSGRMQGSDDMPSRDSTRHRASRLRPRAQILRRISDELITVLLQRLQAVTDERAA